jgi:hypothetical protein
MAVNTLSDPLIKLNNLPTTMKWLSEWSPTTQYYKNDVTVSPTTSGSYILRTASDYNSSDPSISPSWLPVGRSAGGIENLRKGIGIDLSGSSTRPQVINNGVVDIIYGTNMQNIGTRQDVVLDTTAIATITGIIGIDTTNLPTITNSGVTSVTGNGFGFSSQTGNTTITNQGVLSLASTDSNLTITAGQDPIILNNGLLALVDGTGITNVSTTPNEYTLQNDGVRTIQFPSNTLLNKGSSSYQKLAAANCQICEVWTDTGVTGMTPNPTKGNVTDATIFITQTPNTLWANCLATGVPYSAGVFEIDMTGFFFYFFNISRVATRFIYSLLDSVTGNKLLLGTSKSLFPAKPTSIFTLGKISVDLQAARNAGIRQLTGFEVVMEANFPGVNFALFQVGKGLAVFSPLSLQ